MADNYLEKRYEEVFGKGAKGNNPLIRKPSLDTLLQRCSSEEEFDKSYKVHTLQIEAIMGVSQKLSAVIDLRHFEFHPVLKDSEASIIISIIGEKNPDTYIDLGILLQSMLLKASELGLAGHITRNSDFVIISLGKPA